ncbi:MAG: adenylate/guanylate cyclase domain-containing protein [Bacteroidota bacterium]
MKIPFYILFLFLPLAVFSQSSDSVKDDILQLFDKRKDELSIALQNGLAKWRLGKNEKDQELFLEACLELAELYDSEEYHEKQLTFLEQAVSVANELGKDELRLSIQADIAHSYFENGRWEETYEISETLFEQHQVFGLYAPAIRDLERMAASAAKLNNYVKAREHYVKIMEIARIVGDKPVELTAMNNMGFTANHLENYKEAIHYFEMSEAIANRNNDSTPGYVFTNLGIAWQNLGQTDRALSNLRQAEQKDKTQKSYIQHLISSIYLTNEDIYNALTYNERAIAEAEKTKDMRIMSDAFEMASEIYRQLHEYDKALDYFQKHLSLKDSLDRIDLVYQKEMENIHSYLDDTENSILQNLAETELKQATVEQAELERKATQLEIEKKEEEKLVQQQKIALLEKEREAKEATILNQQLEAERTRQELALATQTTLALQRESQLSDLQRQRERDSLESVRLQEKQQMELMEAENKIELQRQKDEAFRRQMYGLAIVGFIIFAIITGSWLYGRKLNKTLANKNTQIKAQNKEIESERNRAEGLLLNILPAAIAYELKEKGAATPKHYDAVSVLFTDFEGFTAIASTMHPEEVVHELNECFMKFDEIADKYHMEKIKTIGDSYMCAGGLPVKNNTHPVDAVSAAKEMMAYNDARNNRLIAEGKRPWPIRIGIHTGELVAGVVGAKKFAYDIWGDTVNVASRMESNSEAGKINISEATYQLVSDKFKCKFRGEIDVKNKGKMGMYLVDG